MAKKSKNSANVVAAMPCGGDEYHSTEIRKIDNGYVTRMSHSGPDGYKSSESFSAKKPSLSAGPAQSDGKDAHGGALRAAITHIRGK